MKTRYCDECRHFEQMEKVEPVAEVVWFDPVLQTMPEKAGKIIDGSLAFIDSAALGTKLYTAPITHEEKVESDYEICIDYSGLVLLKGELKHPHGTKLYTNPPHTKDAPELKAFANLIIEECARVCESKADEFNRLYSREADGAMCCAKVIREMKK